MRRLGVVGVDTGLRVCGQLFGTATGPLVKALGLSNLRGGGRPEGRDDEASTLLEADSSGGALEYGSVHAMWSTVDEHRLKPLFGGRRRRDGGAAVASAGGGVETNAHRPS